MATNRRNVTQTVDPFADAAPAAPVEAIVETPAAPVETAAPAAPTIDLVALGDELSALKKLSGERGATAAELVRTAEIYAILMKQSKAAAKALTAGESKAEIAAKAAAAAAEANAQLDKVRVALNTAIVSAIDAVKNEGNTVPKFTLTYSPETGLEIKTASVKVTASAGNGGTRTRNSAPANAPFIVVAPSKKALERWPQLATIVSSKAQYKASELAIDLGLGTMVDGKFVGHQDRNKGSAKYALNVALGAKACQYV